MSQEFVTTTKHFRKLLAAGDPLIVLLVVTSSASAAGEWRRLGVAGTENRESTASARKNTMVYGWVVVELSLLGVVGAGMGR